MLAVHSVTSTSVSRIGCKSIAGVTSGRASLMFCLGATGFASAVAIPESSKHWQSQWHPNFGPGKALVFYRSLFLGSAVLALAAVAGLKPWLAPKRLVFATRIQSCDGILVFVPNLQQSDLDCK